MANFIRVLISYGLVFGLLVISGCDDSKNSSDAVNQAPTAAINSPSDGGRYISGTSVAFSGTGTDPEDGEVLGSTYVWTSTLDGQIQSGRKNFFTDGLSIGTHAITLTVTDSDGAAGTDAISVSIFPQIPAGDIINSIGMTFNYIFPGTFTMGSPATEFDPSVDEPWRSDEAQHQVTLTQGYYMQTTEVTQGQWKSVMGTNPSIFDDCGDSCPVEYVSWDDAQSFIEELNRMEGTNVYRLPTEAEWEYAARAGTTTPFAFGDCLSTSQANYQGRKYPYNGCTPGTDRGRTIAVGNLEGNAWGLYDMHGNVQEWCLDWYGSYPSGSVTDPEGPTSGTSRVLRGGFYDSSGFYCRSALRARNKPGIPSGGFGFRVVMIPGR